MTKPVPQFLAYTGLRQALAKHTKVANGMTVSAGVFMDPGRNDLYVEMNGKPAFAIMASGKVMIHINGSWHEVISA